MGSRFRPRPLFPTDRSCGQSEMLKTLSIFGYLGMVGGLVGLLATHSLLSSSPLAIVPQAAAVLLMVWARVAFGRRSFHAAANPADGGLVTAGPYRYIRHPIYSAVCLFSAAGLAGHWSWYAAALFAVILACALMRMRCEEVLLASRYSSYHDYAAKTPRMIPHVF